MQKENKDELRVKMLVIGESAVGKSSLITQYVDNSFNVGHVTTIGVEYKQKILNLEGNKTLKVQIWDTAGTARYNTVTPNFYRNVDGILLIYDVTSEHSFKMVSSWIKEVHEKTDISQIELMLVGNKIDLEE